METEVPGGRVIHPRSHAGGGQNMATLPAWLPSPLCRPLSPPFSPAALPPPPLELLTSFGSGSACVSWSTFLMPEHISDAAAEKSPGVTQEAPLCLGPWPLCRISMPRKYKGTCEFNIAPEVLPSRCTPLASSPLLGEAHCHPGWGKALVSGSNPALRGLGYLLCHPPPASGFY